MAINSRTIEAQLEADAELRADSVDKFVCVLFCTATLLGTAWFYWHVMCSAQRALWRTTASAEPVAQLRLGDREIFMEPARRMGFSADARQRDAAMT